ncbi:hypothetical protein LUZ60_008931 [Juncus effusus]|nr:hypothetical protein LUZ60_008931 [Juncus effusus]
MFLKTLISTPAIPKIVKTPFLTASHKTLHFLKHPLTSRAYMSSSSPDPIAAGESPTQPCTDGGGSSEDVIVQYVVLRRDLIDTWPLGSVVTQGCHASVAALWAHKDHPDTLNYCSDLNIDSMHKVTLEVKGETQLRDISKKLDANGIKHKLWIEQPENFPTCLATRPCPKSQVAPLFKKLKLCK